MFLPSGLSGCFYYCLLGSFVLDCSDYFWRKLYNFFLNFYWLHLSYWFFVNLYSWFNYLSYNWSMEYWRRFICYSLNRSLLECNWTNIGLSHWLDECLGVYKRYGWLDNRLCVDCIWSRISNIRLSVYSICLSISNNLTSLKITIKLQE